MQIFKILFHDYTFKTFFCNGACSLGKFYAIKKMDLSLSFADLEHENSLRHNRGLKTHPFK